MHKPEFKAGDSVTFKPYEKECKCTIREVLPQQTYLNGELDQRVHYRISGEALSHTTGASIMESMYFDAWTDEKRANFFK